MSRCVLAAVDGAVEAGQSASHPSLGWFLLTGGVSAVLSVVSAWLTFQFVRKRELDTQFEQKQAELEIQMVNRKEELEKGLQLKKEELEKGLQLKKEELEHALRLDVEKSRLLRQSERQERIRERVVQYADPILLAVDDLLARLQNILKSGGYSALTTNWDAVRPPNWSTTHRYIVDSTLYLFGRYFARAQQLADRLGSDVFRAQAEKDALFTALRKVGTALSEYPSAANRAGCGGDDTQVFVWQQRAMGEALAWDDVEEGRLLTYAAFTQRDDRMSLYFEPLLKLLVDLSPDPRENCRWERLVHTGRALESVRSECRNLLALPTDR